MDRFVFDLQRFATMTITIPGNLAAEGDGAPKSYYYKLTESGGEYTLGEALQIYELTDDAKYLKCEVSNYYDEPEIIVSIVGQNGIDAQLTDDLEIKATNATTVDSTPLAYLTFQNNLTSGELSVTDVTPAAVVTVGSTKYTHNTSTPPTISYTRTYSLDKSSSTIALTDDMMAGMELNTSKTYNYAITATDKGRGSFAYSIGAGTTDAVVGAHFAVEVSVDENGKATYNVSFSSGTVSYVSEEAVLQLTDECWSKINIDASGLTKNNAAAVNITGDTIDDAKDKYALKNLAYGISYGDTAHAADAEGYDITSVTRPEDGVQLATITYKAQNGDEATGVALKNFSPAATTYWEVTQTEGDDGNLQVVIQESDATDETAITNSYIKVTAAADAEDDTKGTCTVEFVAKEGGVDLSALKASEEAGVIVDLVPADGMTNKTSVIVNGDKATYAVFGELPAGTEAGVAENNENGVVLNEVSYTTAYINNVVIPLSKLSESENATYYFEVTAVANLPSDGYENVTCSITADSDGDVPTSPNEATSYFVVVKDDYGYTISYQKGSNNIDLGLATTLGKVNIDTAGIDENTPAIIIDSSANNENNGIVYEVTNVQPGGYGENTTDEDIGIYEADTDTISSAKAAENVTTLTKKASDISYATAYKLVQEEADTISLAHTDYLYKVTKDDDGIGTTTFTIAKADGTTVTIDETDDSYFKVVYDSDAKTYSIVYHESAADTPAASTVSRADFANVFKEAANKVNVDASNDTNPEHAASIVADATTLALTADGNDGSTAINYNVINLPSHITTISEQGESDSCTYAVSYEFATGGNDLALGKDAGTLYYAVTTSGPNEYGVYSATIAENGEEDQPTEGSYFTVTTAANGDVTITYTKSDTADVAKDIDLTGLTVSVDASTAANTAVITVGSDGETGSYSIINMHDDQTAARGENYALTPAQKYDATSVIAYIADDDNGITVDGFALPAATDPDNLPGPFYYKVEKTGGNDSNADKGVTTYTITAVADETEAAAYNHFEITYTADGVAVVYHKHGDEESAFGLSEAGQVVIDADNLTSGNLDITDTEDNRVNYTLKNVKAGVTVVNPDPTGDISYKEKSISLTEDSVIILDGTEKTWVVKRTTVDDETTYSLELGEPDDSVNYFTISKAGDDYTITYTKSTDYTESTDAGYAIEGAVVVNAADIPAGTITSGSKDVTFNVTNAKPGTAVKGQNISVSYTTGFKWAEGTYYVPLTPTEETGSDTIPTAPAALDANAEAGSTVKEGGYLVVEVTEEGGVNKVTTASKVSVADSNTGMLPANVEEATAGDDYTGVVTLTAPAYDEQTPFKLDATGFKGEIVDVPKDAVLTGVGDDAKITFVAPQAGDSISVNEKTYKATTLGGKIVLQGGKVVSGTLHMDFGLVDSLTGADGQAIALLNNTDAYQDGLNVTFEEGTVTKVSGLTIQGGRNTQCEAFSYGGYQYFTRTFDDENVWYVLKIKPANKETGAAAEYYFAPLADHEGTVDVLGLEYYQSTSPSKVPTASTTTFSWEAGTYILPVTTVEDVNSVVIKAGEPTYENTGEIAAGEQYFLQAVVSTPETGNKTLELTVLQNNTYGLPTQVEDSLLTGTVNITGGESAFNLVKPENAGYTLALTDVAADSVISGLGASDTLTTAALNANDVVIVNEKKYTAAAATTLSFQSDVLQSGNIKLNGGDTGTTVEVYYDNKPATITLTGGNSTVAVENVSETETPSYTVTAITGLDNGKSITISVPGTAGAHTEVTYSNEAGLIKRTDASYDGTSEEPTSIFTYVITLDEENANDNLLYSGNAEYLFDGSMDLSTSGTSSILLYGGATGNIEASVATTGESPATVSVTMTEGDLTGITGLGDKESLTLTTGTEEDGTTTVYDITEGGYYRKTVTVKKPGHDDVESTYTVAPLNGNLIAGKEGLVTGTFTLTTESPQCSIYSFENEDYWTADYGYAGPVTLKAENGVVTSITGLNTPDETLTLTKYPSAFGASPTFITYRVNTDENNAVIYTKTVEVSDNSVNPPVTSVTVYRITSDSEITNLIGNTELLYDGTVTVSTDANNPTLLYDAENGQVEAIATGTVSITMEDGVLKAATGFDNGESLSITPAGEGAAVTTYTCVDAAAKKFQVAVTTPGVNTDPAVTTTYRMNLADTANNNVLSTANQTGLVDGIITLTDGEADHQLVAYMDDDTTTLVTYTHTDGAADAGHTARLEVTTTAGVTSITSISGLGDGERAVLTYKDSEGNTLHTDTYVANAVEDGIKITRFVDTNGHEDSAQIVVEGDTFNIMSTEAVWETTSAYSNNLDLDQMTDGSVAYFTYAGKGADLVTIVATDKSGTTQSVEDGTQFIRLKTEVVDVDTSEAEDNRLKLTLDAIIAEGGSMKTSKEYDEFHGKNYLEEGSMTYAMAGSDVIISLGTQPVLLDFNDTIFNVHVNDAASGSIFGMRYARGESVSTKVFTESDLNAEGGATVTINGQTYKAAAQGPLIFSGVVNPKTEDNNNAWDNTNSPARIMDGSIYLTGTDKVYSIEGFDVTYTAGTGDTANTDGVVVGFNNGELADLTDLEVGEKVTITKYNSNTSNAAADISTTTTYEAQADNVIMKTVVSNFGTENKTTSVYVVQLGTNDDMATVDVMDIGNASSSDETGKWQQITAQPYPFAWQPGTSACFEVGADGTLTVATTTDDEGDYHAVSIGPENKGQPYIQATLAADGTLTLAKVVVDYKGTPVVTPLAENEKLADELVLNAAATTFTYAKADVGTVDANYVGNGSVLTGFTAYDTASAVFHEGGTVTINGHKYTAASQMANGLYFKGTENADSAKVTGGVFVLSPENGNSNNDTADNLSTGTDTVSYVGTGNIQVTVEFGKVTSVTGLGVGESATVTSGDVTTIYSAAEDLVNDKIIIYKTVGTSTWSFAADDDTLDVLAVQNWDAYSVDTTTKFAFGDTTVEGATSVGYFKVTVSNNLNTQTGTASAWVTIKPQTGETIQAPGKAEDTVSNDDRLYLKAEAVQNDDGITLSNLKAVYLEDSGVFTELNADTFAEYYSQVANPEVTVVLPVGKNVAFVQDDSPLYSGLKVTFDQSENATITPLATDVTITGLTANDTLTATQALGQTITLGSGENAINFKAAAEGLLEISGEGYVTTGTLLLGAGSLTAATSGAVVAYSTDGDVEEGKEGVIVTFANGALTTLTELDANEEVTVTEPVMNAQTEAYEDKVTVYTKDVDANDNPYFVKSVTENGVTELWAAVSGINLIDTSGYNHASKFAWETGGTTVAYFQYGATAASVNIAEQEKLFVASLSYDKNLVKLQITETKGEPSTYSIDDLTIYDGNSGDITAEAGVEITLTAPGNLFMADTEPETRNYTFTIAGDDGQTFTGFTEKDVITATLEQGGSLTAGATTFVWNNAVAGNANLTGDGQARDGDFTLGGNTASDSFITTGGFTVSITADDNAETENEPDHMAHVVVKNGEIDSIDGLDVGEKATILFSKPDEYHVEQITYTAYTNDDGKIVYKKAVTTDEGDTVWYDSQPKETTNVDITKDDTMGYGDSNQTSYIGDLNWTDPKSRGYFAVDSSQLQGNFEVDEDGKIVNVDPDTGITGITGTIEMGAVNEDKDVDKDDGGTVYLKISTTYDEATNTVTVTELRALLADVSILSADKINWTTGAVTIVAPADAAMKLDLTTLGEDKLNMPTAATLTIQGAAAGSEFKLRDGDKLDLNTTKLAADATVTINGHEYIAGAADTQLVFDHQVVLNGVLKLTKENNTFTAAGADGKGEDTADNMTVTYDTSDSDTPVDPVVTVENGVVTKIEGLDQFGTLTTVADGVTTIYTRPANSEVLKASISGLGTKPVTVYGSDEVAVNTGDNTVTLKTDANTPLVLQDENSDGVPEIVSGVVIVDQANNQLYTSTGESLATTGSATVTVTGGEIAKIEGMKAGTTLSVNDSTGTTIYELDSAGKLLTKTDPSGNMTAAFITDGNVNLLSVYYSNPDSLVGQFSWDTSIEGRNMGFFKIASNKATVAEQASEVTTSSTKGGTVSHIVASISEDKVLTLDALDVVSTPNEDKTYTTTLEAHDISSFDISTTVNITASTQPFTYNKGTGATAAGFALNFTKVAAYSHISNLDAGDKVTTAALAEDAKVYIDGKTFISGAKNTTLVFLGEGDNVKPVVPATESLPARFDCTTALLSGTIKLEEDESAVLAGDSDTNEKKNKYLTSNDITVTNNSSDDVIVKVTNGVVSSITGLTTQEGSVTVENASYSYKDGSKTVTVSGATYTYTVLDEAGTMIKREVSYTPVGASEAITATQFMNLTKAGGEIISSSGYKDAVSVTSDLNFDNAETSARTTVGYVALGAAPNQAEDKTIYSSAKNDEADNDLAGWASDDTSGYGSEDFIPTPGNFYLQISASTAGESKGGLVTISKIEVMKADATGKLVATKSTDPTYTSTLTINGWKSYGTLDDDDETQVSNYAAFKCTSLPAANKREWAVNFTNVAADSEFSNMGEGDSVTTAALGKNDKIKVNNVTYVAAAVEENAENTFVFKDGLAAGGTFLMSSASKSITTNEGTKVDYSTVKDDVVIIIEEGKVTSLTGLATKGEKVTVTETGGAVTIYEVLDEGKVQRTETTTAGLKTIATTTYIGADTNVFSTNFEWTTSTSSTTLNSTFDWTTAKNTTGYFKITSGATASTASALTNSTAAQEYLAVTISGDGVVSEIRQVKFSGTALLETDDEDYEPTEVATINLTAPKTVALELDRDDLADTLGSAKLVITGALADSYIDNLKAGDTVTTASLKAGNSVTINENEYTAGAAGALSFGYNNTSEILTSGTITLDGDETDLGGNSVNYFDGDEVHTITATGENSTITVKASTSSKAETIDKVKVTKQVTTYTIGDLGENETFTVDDITYQKSVNKLFKVKDDTITVYDIGTKTSVDSKILESTETKTWSNVTATFKDDGTSNFGTVKVDLTTLAKRVTADEKAGTGKIGYSVVADTYTKEGTSNTAGVTGMIVANAAEGWQTELGEIKTLSGHTYYAADDDIAQNITGVAGWNVYGSDKADEIKGASSGTNVIEALGGDDKITLGGASETVREYLGGDGDIGQDEITGYASGKDEIIVGNVKFAVKLDTTSDGVYIFNDTNSDGKYDKGENGFLLKGVAGKAVTINEKTYYFGNGKLAKTDDTQTKTGATFTYVEGAFYYGNDSGKNTLKVTTDKTKATKTTLGAAVEVDLNAEGTTDYDDQITMNRYTNINTVDASSSGNEVVLTAGNDADTSYTLKGGTYKSTLKAGAGNDTLTGGSGEDTFYFADGLAGEDTIANYTVGKDKLYMAGATDLTGATEGGFSISATGKSGNDIEISQVVGEDTAKVTITGKASPTQAITVVDNSGTEVKYYVGKTIASTATKDTTNNFTTFDSSAYYIGNGHSTDTLTLAAKDTKAEIDMTTNKYQSIEVVDATKVGSTKDTNGVTFTAGDANVTFKGSAYADTITSGSGKTYIEYTAAKNAAGDTVTNFGANVDDVIQFNGLKVDAISIQESTDTVGLYTVTATTGSGKSQTSYTMNVTVASGYALDKNASVDGKSVQITTVQVQ